MSRPERATRWLTDGRTGRVLALGVGAVTASALVDLGHEVVAAERDPVALTRCVARGVVGVLVPAEGLPFVASCFDAVVSPPPPVRGSGSALAEAARVLRPGGFLAVVHDRLDETIPWVRRLVADHPDVTGAGDRPWLTSPLFDDPHSAAFGYWQESGVDDLVDLLVRRTGVDRGDAREQALAVHRDHAGGAARLRLRYRTECDRMTVGAAAGPVGTHHDDGGLLVDLGGPARCSAEV